MRQAGAELRDQERASPRVLPAEVTLSDPPDDRYASPPRGDPADEIRVIKPRLDDVWRSSAKRSRELPGRSDVREALAHSQGAHCDTHRADSLTHHSDVAERDHFCLPGIGIHGREELEQHHLASADGKASDDVDDAPLHSAWPKPRDVTMIWKWDAGMASTRYMEVSGRSVGRSWIGVTLLTSFVVILATEWLTPRQHPLPAFTPLALNVLAFAAFTSLVIAVTNRTLFSIGLVASLYELLVL